MYCITSNVSHLLNHLLYIYILTYNAFSISYIHLYNGASVYKPVVTSEVSVLNLQFTNKSVYLH